MNDYAEAFACWHRGEPASCASAGGRVRVSSHLGVALLHDVKQSRVELVSLAVRHLKGGLQPEGQFASLFLRSSIASFFIFSKYSDSTIFETSFFALS